MYLSLCDAAADIVQNCAESGARRVELELRETASEFRFTAKDNGPGMDKAALDRAVDSGHPAGKRGQGIPLLIRTALQSDGGWSIRSTREGKTAVRSSEDTADGSERKGGEISGDAKHPQDLILSDSERFNPGTTVEAWFMPASPNTPPPGDIPGLWRTALLFRGPKEIVLRRIRRGGGSVLQYEVKKTELIEALGDLEEVSSLVLLDRYLRSLEE